MGAIRYAMLNRSDSSGAARNTLQRNPPAEWGVTTSDNADDSECHARVHGNPPFLRIRMRIHQPFQQISD
jgi:hypothetical protein